MFINSEQLKNKIQLVVNEITLKSDGKIVFEEYISLPYYGSIILRFNLNHSDYTVADLDRYEAMMAAFAAYVRGDEINPYTPEYELALYKTILQTCKEEKT